LIEAGKCEFGESLRRTRLLDESLPRFGVIASLGVALLQGGWPPRCLIAPRENSNKIDAEHVVPSGARDLTSNVQGTSKILLSRLRDQNDNAIYEMASSQSALLCDIHGLPISKLPALPRTEFYALHL